MKEKPSKEEIKKHIKLAMEMKTDPNPIPAKVKRIGFYTRLEEFIKEDVNSKSKFPHDSI